MDPALLIKAFGGFFAIMNPFVALPMFLALTTGADVKSQRRTAVRVALFSLLMVAVIIATGSAVLSFFGISVDDFRGSRGHRAAHDRTRHAQRRQRGPLR